MKTLATRNSSEMEHKQHITRFLGAVGLLIVSFCLAGCWGDPPVGPGGTVVLGPVAGATIYADRITPAFPQGNGVKDDDELTTVTDSKGTFRYPRKVGYDYISRSIGGTDTITGKPAIPMAAPAGVDTVTPITTMVASVPKTDQAALITKLENIMGGYKYDSNPTINTTPAALALAKTIETSMEVVAKAAEEAATTAGTTISTANLNSMMGTVSSAIATELAKPTTTTATLSSATSMATLMGTATQAAATTISTSNEGVSFYDTTTIAQAVTTASTTVATAIAVQSGQTAASMGTTANTKVQESAVISQLTVQLESAVSNAAQESVTSIASIPTTTTDTVPPAIKAGSFDPLAGATDVPVTALVNVGFTKPMNPAYLTSTYLSITGPGGAAVPATITYSTLTNTATITPTSPLAFSTPYTVTVSGAARDLSANLPLTAGGSWTFTTAAFVDTVAPTYTITPANAATGVARNAVVVVTFNKDVKASTVNSSSITLKPGTNPAATPVSGFVRYDNVAKTATFIPGANLSYSTTYTVTVNNSIVSLSNVAVAGSSTTFTTVASPDTTPPTASIVSPSSASLIPYDAVFVAQFSEAMDVSTLTNVTFTLKYQSNSVVIPGTVIYNSVDKTATFTPSAPLPGNRIVVATLTAGAKDLGGNPLTPPAPVVFTTVKPLTGTGGSNVVF